MCSFKMPRRWFRLVVSLLFIPLAGPVPGWGQQPMVIPQPRELQVRQGNFAITSNLEIVLLPVLAGEDRIAADNLEEELRAVTGENFAIVSSAPAETTPAIVLGRLDQPDMKKLLAAGGLNTAGIGEQGYVLDVTPGRVLVAGKDAAGLFYGVQTLKQLLVGDAQHAEILGAEVRDWPALLYRGTQVDMARGPVPKLEYLKHIVRTIAEFKLNQLVLYMEDSFRLEGQPLVGVLSDTLQPGDWRDLIAFAARYHVDIVPAQNSCGHLHKILRFEDYADLAETPHGSVLAPQPISANLFC